MRNAKRFLAAATALTMVLTPVTAFAAEANTPDAGKGTIEGEGQFEGYVNKEVFRIILPTVADVDFTLDPQGLLKVADAAKYTIGEGAVYFANAVSGGGDPTYSATSDAITIKNKSSYPVDVDLKVTLKNMAEGIALVEESALADATSPSLYLGVKVNDDGTPEAITKTEYTAEKQELADIMASYEVIGSTTDPGDGAVISPNGYYYSFKLGSSFSDDDAPSVSYYLTGKCDTVADWSEVNTSAVTAEIVWSCTKHSGVVAETSISGSAYSRTNTANTYNITWASAVADSDKRITSILVSTDGVTYSESLAVPTTAYSLSSDYSTLTIDGTLNAVIGQGGVGNPRYLKVTFGDGKSATITVNVTA